MFSSEESSSAFLLSPHVLAQNGQKQTDPGSLEDLSRDETDRAVPLSEPISIQRRSPLIRNHKTGSMEVRPSAFTALKHPALTFDPVFLSTVITVFRAC